MRPLFPWILLAAILVSAAGAVVGFDGRTSQAVIATASPSPSVAAAVAAGAIGPVVTWADAMTAFGTVGAVVLALLLAIWGDWLRRLLLGPTLTVTIDRRPPDCIGIDAEVRVLPPDPRAGQVVGYERQYYCRLRISNSGHSEAADVEVQLLRLWRVAADGSIQADLDFMPLNLVWSHSVPPQVTRPKLQPGLFKHCDLCHVTHSDPTLLRFNTEWQPTPLRRGVFATLKPRGRYQLDIALAASNARTKTVKVSIDWLGWENDERDMFDRGLRVQLVP